VTNGFERGGAWPAGRWPVTQGVVIKKLAFRGRGEGM